MIIFILLSNLLLGGNMTLLETFFPEFYVDRTSCQYNMVRVNDSEILLELNVAGIPESEIDVEVSGNRLTISANIEDIRDYLHKGIYNKSFKTSFTLKEDLVVKSAVAKNGILSIQLEYQVPEEKKPRKILLTH